MREIKFRAWDIEGERMVYDPYYWDQPTGIHCQYYEDWRDLEDGRSHSCEIMQYTGLKDKNGKEIYEGDIIPEKIFIDCDRSESTIICNGIHQKTIMAPHVVTFIQESCEYKLVNNDYNTKTPFWAFCKRCNQSEVIGNIHENPEILTP